MKILPTIGPVTEDTKSLKYISDIFNLIRLNGAHNSIKWHTEISKKLKKLNPNIKILLDIPGIKPRTINSKDISILKGEKVVFIHGKKNLNLSFKTIQISNPIPKLKKNLKNFTISDGQFLFKIKSLKSNYVIGESNTNFILKPNKGVNFQGSIYDNKLQEKKYINFLKNINHNVFDAVGLSFVQDEKIISKIRRALSNKIIISKIENIQGMKNLEKIIINSDAIMIDKGDLSAEIGEEKLFKSISKIVSICKNFGKPIITATENLDSMIERKSPTKSEIIALGYSNDIGIDMIMLSDETATSDNWKNTLKWLNIFLSNKNSYEIDRSYQRDMFIELIQNVKGIPVVVFTRKGFVIEKISKINKQISMFVFTDNNSTYTSSSIRNNTISFKINKFPKLNFANFIQNNLKEFSNYIFKDTNIILLLHISFPNKASRADTIRLVNKRDLF